ncbi:mitochondrial antiviral-signaling protein [Discoglossus pictus]
MGFAEDKLADYLRRNINQLETLNLEEILIYMTCLSQGTQEKLRQKLEIKGNVHTLWPFVDEIRKRDGWVQEFLSAIRRCGQVTLADEIEVEYNRHVVQPSQQKSLSFPPSLPPSEIFLVDPNANTRQPMLVHQDRIPPPQPVPPSYYQNVPSQPLLPSYQAAENPPPQYTLQPQHPQEQAQPPPPPPVPSHPQNQLQQHGSAHDHIQPRAQHPVQPDNERQHTPPYSSSMMESQSSNSSGVSSSSLDIEKFQEYKTPVPETHMSIDAVSSSKFRCPSSSAAPLAPLPLLFQLPLTLQGAEASKERPSDAPPTYGSESRGAVTGQYRETQVHQTPVNFPSVSSEEAHLESDYSTHSSSLLSTREKTFQNQISRPGNQEAHQAPVRYPSVPSEEDFSEPAVVAPNPRVLQYEAKSVHIQTSRPENKEELENIQVTLAPKQHFTDPPANYPLETGLAVTEQNSGPASQVGEAPKQSSQDPPANHRSETRLSVTEQYRGPVSQPRPSPSSALSDPIPPAQEANLPKVVELHRQTSPGSPSIPQSDHTLPTRGQDPPRADVINPSIRRQPSSEEEDENYLSKPQILRSNIDHPIPLRRDGQAEEQPLSRQHKFQISVDASLRISDDSARNNQQYRSGQNISTERGTSPGAQTTPPILSKSDVAFMDNSRVAGSPNSTRANPRSKTGPEENDYQFENSPGSSKASRDGPRVYVGGDRSETCSSNVSWDDPLQHPEEISFSDDMDIRSFRIDVVEEPNVQLNEGNDMARQRALFNGSTTHRSDKKERPEATKENHAPREILIPSLAVAVAAITVIVLLKYLRK